MLVVLAAHPVGAQDFVCGTQADTSRQSSYDVDPLQPTRALILFVKFQDDTQDPPCLLANWPSSLGDSIPAWGDDLLSPDSTRMPGYRPPSISDYFDEMSLQAHWVYGDVINNLPGSDLDGDCYIAPYNLAQSPSFDVLNREILDTLVTRMGDSINWADYDINPRDGYVDQIWMFYRRFSEYFINGAGATGVAVLIDTVTIVTNDYLHWARGLFASVRSVYGPERRCIAYVIGELPPEVCERMEKHVSTCRACGSRPVVGSSSRSTRGSCARARAKNTRRRSPPERASSRRSARGRRSQAWSAPSTAPRSKRSAMARSPWRGARPIITASRTVKGQATRGSCGTRAATLATTLRDAAAGSSPARRTEPALGASRPATSRMSVLFPAPFGPTSPTSSPAAAPKETASRTGRSP